MSGLQHLETESPLSSCFSAAALGVIVGKLYYEVHMRRELARHRGTEGVR
jgi:hypothetical protein